MTSSTAAYTKALVGRAWSETRSLFFQKSLKVYVRDILLLLGGILLMYLFQERLVALRLLPHSSNLMVNKALPVAFGAAAFAALYAVYFAAELFLIAPYRLWSEQIPPSPTNAGRMVDEETRKLAGVVAALRDRVLIWGFKTPVSFDDSYFNWLQQVERSTLPIWIDGQARGARMEFVHASKALPHVNGQQGELNEIEHWRAVVKANADELIGLLMGTPSAIREDDERRL